MKKAMYWYETPKNRDSIPFEVKTSKAAVSKETIVKLYLEELGNNNTQNLTVYNRVYNRLVQQKTPVSMKTIRLVLRAYAKNR